MEIGLFKENIIFIGWLWLRKTYLAFWDKKQPPMMFGKKHSDSWMFTAVCFAVLFDTLFAVNRMFSTFLLDMFIIKIEIEIVQIEIEN